MTRCTARLLPRIHAFGMLALAMPMAGAAAPIPINASAPEWPPYFYSGTGFARGILDRCLPAGGYAPRYSTLPVDRIFTALQDGTLDVHVMPRSTDRERYVTLGSEPLFHDGYRAVVRRSSTAQFRRLRDLDSLVLGYQRGPRYTSEFLAYVRSRPVGSVVEAASATELVTLLRAGKIDVFVALGGTIRSIAKSSGAERELRILEHSVSDSDYFLAVSSRSRHVMDSRALLADFDRCVRRLRTEGELAILAKRHGLATDITP